MRGKIDASSIYIDIIIFLPLYSYFRILISVKLTNMANYLFKSKKDYIKGKGIQLIKSTIIFSFLVSFMYKSLSLFYNYSKLLYNNANPPDPNTRILREKRQGKTKIHSKGNQGRGKTRKEKTGRREKEKTNSTFGCH